MDIISYILSRQFTKQSLIGMGALKGSPCKIKNIVHQDGVNTVTFEWEGTDGSTRESTMVVYDGTPIYVWESGNTYHYGDLAIYESQFYRCIIENSDVTFDNTKWNEIGSPDGNYDIVQSKDLLPARFTAADRKLYFVIDECIFYLWDGYQWVALNHAVQVDSFPVASAKYFGKIYQYIGATNNDYTHGYFYQCVSNGETPAVYSWEYVQTSDIQIATVQKAGIVKPDDETIRVDANGTISVIDRLFVGTQAEWDALTPIQQALYKPMHITDDEEVIDLGVYLRKVKIMPNAEDAPSEFVMYIGATTADYTRGYIYRSVPTVESGETVYNWVRVDTQPSHPYIQSDWAQNDSTANDYIKNKPTLGTASEKNFTDNVRPNSHDLVESNAVYNAISSSIASIYKPHGDLTCAQLTSDLLIAANIGNVYNMTDSGTTSALFIQGAGKTIDIGDTVGIIQADNNTIMFNLMGSMIDLHDYQKQELSTPLTIGGVQETDVEDALEALNDVKATQFTTMPTASVDYVNKIVQYVGSNTQTYTNGFWYKCVSDGAASPTYSWEKVDVNFIDGELTVNDLTQFKNIPLIPTGTYVNVLSKKTKYLITDNPSTTIESIFVIPLNNGLYGEFTCNSDTILNVAINDILPNNNISDKLNELIDIAVTKGVKGLQFNEGVYFIDKSILLKNLKYYGSESDVRTTFQVLKSLTTISGAGGDKVFFTDSSTVNSLDLRNLDFILETSSDHTLYNVETTLVALPNVDGCNIDNCTFITRKASENGAKMSINLLWFKQANNVKNVNVTNCKFYNSVGLNETSNWHLAGGLLWLTCGSDNNEISNINVQNCQFNTSTVDEALCIWSGDNNGLFNNISISDCNFEIIPNAYPSSVLIAIRKGISSDVIFDRCNIKLCARCNNVIKISDGDSTVTDNAHTIFNNINIISDYEFISGENSAIDLFHISAKNPYVIDINNLYVNIPSVYHMRNLLGVSYGAHTINIRNSNVDMTSPSWQPVIMLYHSVNANILLQNDIIDNHCIDLIASDDSHNNIITIEDCKIGSAIRTHYYNGSYGDSYNYINNEFSPMSVVAMTYNTDTVTPITTKAKLMLYNNLFIQNKPIYYYSSNVATTQDEFMDVIDKNDSLIEISKLPTADEAHLGVSYLLTSTQTGYLKGGIYQCVSDGESTPTYSWQLISSADMVEFTAQELQAMW